jgi:WhiB family redox-sensing transcriptional regulator
MVLNFEYGDYPFNGEQLCNESNSDLFFPEEYIDPTKLSEARSICNSCTLVADCLEYALQTPWLEGIWAGTTPRQRTRIRSQRNKKVKNGH